MEDAYSDDMSFDPGRSEGSASDRAYVDPDVYRNDNLAGVQVYINKLNSEHWPTHIQSFVNGLTRDLSASDSHGGPSRDKAATLAGQVGRFVFKAKNSWMRLNIHLFSVFRCRFISLLESIRFNVEVGLVNPSGDYLLTPAPTVTIGLAVEKALRVALSQAPSLTTQVLRTLTDLHYVEPFPVLGSSEIAFPCIIYEAESDTGLLVAAQNKAALGAAKALAMVQTLTDAYGGLDIAQNPSASRLPVIAICSMGHIWEMFVAFELEKEDLPLENSADDDSDPGKYPLPTPGVHMVNIWTGAVHTTETMYQLQVLLQRLREWILEVWRPTVVQMLDPLKATIPTEP
jgi:hypothetical protein